jgi:hypothetical protein
MSSSALSLVQRQYDTFSWTDSGKDAYRAWCKRRHFVAGRDLEPGADTIARAARSSWWVWEDGSRPFHWRWPSWYMETIGDGLKVFFRAAKPKFRKPQRDATNVTTRERMRKKLEKVRNRRYIGEAFVRSLTSFFAVPKGPDDIRMVYDSTVSGLNDSIWVPRFVLPTIETHLQGVDEHMFMSDVDVGDCFLNFILHQELQELAGVDLTHYFGEDGKVLWEAWKRAAMG